MRRTDSVSRMITRAPICEFFSCTKSSETCTRFPAAASNSRCEMGRLRSKAFEQGRSEHSCCDRTTSCTVRPSNSRRGRPKNAFDRSANQHDPRIASEQHQAVLQFGHQLIDVVFKRRENFSAVANLAPKIGDLQRHQSVFIMVGFIARNRLSFPGCHAIEIAADFF